jgi:preprotein translocase subunit SecY
VAFRIGSHIPLPGVDPSAVRAFAEAAAAGMGGIWTYLELLSGGALGRLALFSLGIAPYITASIIVQLLAKASPALEAIAKEGNAGKRILQKYTRYATAGVALLQSIFGATQIPAEILTGPGRIGIVAGMTAGALLVLWLAEQITERGLGNGSSVLILAGIVSQMPSALGEMAVRSREGDLSLGAIPLVLASFLTAVVGAVFVTKAQRRLPLRSPKQIRGRRMSLGGASYLPIQLNAAGVMPVIFASSLLVLPQMLAFVPGLEAVRTLLVPGGFAVTLFELAAIVFFSYFWTYLFFRPSDVALQLKENGTFIAGIRPGQTTADHVERILVRLTLAGALFLSTVALAPTLAGQALGVEKYFAAFLGGTGLLIVVGVALDLASKLESYLLMHRYSGFVKESR